ncbi:FG-GAP-like repeat-containing protein [Bacteroidota bacterium]
MFLATDQIVKIPWCESSDGGTYKYQALLVNDGQQTGWALGDNAFAINVIVDYPTKTPSNHLIDVTEDYDLPTNLSRSSIATADINGDKYLELLVTGKLFENMEGEFFEEITGDAGLSGSPSANAFLDMDNDGDLDILFIMQGAGSKSKIFINDGEGNFTGSDLNIPELSSVTCFSIADINDDMYPDLFVGQLWKEYPQSQPNYMLLNDKNNDFTDNTAVIYPDYDGEWNYPNEEWDPDNSIVERNRNSRGSQWVDFDNDGDLDLFVTNYFLQWDEFYENNGDGSFTDIIAQKNIDVNQTGHNHGTGVDWCDYDNDGDMDLLLSQFAHPRYLQYDHRPLTIYKNNGGSGFSFTDTYDPEHYKSTIGLGYEETYAGAAWGDANNDGLADFIATTFYGCRFIDFYMQKSDNTFENRTFEFGLEGIVTGEDACWLDFDNDGKLDLAMSIDRKFRLFKNYYDLNFDWIEIDLQGKDGQENHIIGARVKVYTNNGTYMQEVSNGRGQKMQKPARLHFGLGSKADITKIEVRWPGDTEFEEYFGRNKNQIVNLIQDKGGEPEAPPAPVLESPEDGAMAVDISTELLIWLESEDADKYHVMTASDESFGSVVIDDNNVSDTEYSITELEGETTYFWKVRAGSYAGFGDWSESRSFTTAEVIKETPGIPELISPDDGAIEVDRNTGKFVWSATDGALEYNLQVSENYAFDPVELDISGLTSTEFPVSDLGENTTYFWRVRAWNKAGYGDWSVLRNFTTDDSRVDYPFAPALLSPANNTENVQQDAYLSWTAGAGATSYRIQIATYYTMSDIIVDETIRQSKYAVGSLDGETEYYWRIYSVNSRGESEESSDQWSFTTGVFSGVKELEKKPDNFYLGNIVPNPLSAYTTFEIGIINVSYVSLKIYNTKGEQVATVLSEEMAPGTYMVSWTPKNLESGVYYVQLNAGMNSKTKKLVIIR